MKERHIILPILIAFVMVAWPHSQSSIAEAEGDNMACCQGPHQNCCCSKQAATESSDPANPGDDCQCNMSGLPIAPLTPMEFNEYRLNDRPVNIPTTSFVFEDVSSKGNRLSISANSPPGIVSRPSYVLFGALLI